MSSFFNKLFKKRQASNEVHNTKKALESSQKQITKLGSLFQSMSEALVFCNDQWVIDQANPAFYRLFALKERAEGKTLMEVLREEALKSLFEKAIREKQKIEEEITLFKFKPKLALKVQAIPVQEKGFEGVIGILRDQTRTKELEKSRQEFVANVSHELKTPLTSIRGYTETLLSGALNKSETAERFVKKIHHHAKTLQRLIEELLDLSQLEAGRLKVELQKLSINNLIENCLEEFEEEFQKKDISLVFEKSGDLKILGEASFIQQILFNLLQNSLNYTSEGGQVKITVNPKDKLAQVQVSDTGIGISPEDLPHVFERFWRADKARSRESGGTGLGLAIVKHLTQSMEGKVEVQSETGKGSTFMVSLPLA